MGEDPPEERPTVQSLIEKFGLGEKDRALLEAFEALLDSRLHEGKARRRGPMHDTTYKGREHWLKFRAKVLAIVHRNAFVTWGLLDEDPWFRQDSPPEGVGGGMQDHKQWHRAVYAHLIKNKPHGPEEFVAFQLREKGTRFVTARKYLHCAILKAVGRRKDARSRVRELRRRYQATTRCAWDERGTGAGTVEESLQTPVSPRTLPEEEDVLHEEERAVLQARRQSAHRGVTD